MTEKQQKFADEYIINKCYGIVYCLENTINNKRYIGVTTRTLQKRFDEHCKADSYIGKAIRKYGAENFQKYVLDQAGSHAELCDLEIYYIEKYDTYHQGYNLTLGGDGVVKNIYLKVELNEKQKDFVDFVNQENKKVIDVMNSDEMVRMCLLNISQCFLISDSKKDKQTSAKMILKLKSKLLESVLKLQLFSIEELRRWAKWQSTQNGLLKKV